VALAEHLSLPLLSLVDTPGAEPGATAEAGGIAAEIAATYVAFAEASIPTVAVCVGEGGSGGALATAVCDVLLMQEHAVFSVVSPEAAAAILARDATKAADYATQLKLTASDLAELGITDATIPETDPAALDAAVSRALDGARPGERLRRLDALTARWVD
jgi:acetyl-CoA carboxylase carboxyl transferase subunit beta